MEAAMTEEAKKARAQYLNGLAVAVITITVSVVLAGGSWWLLAVAGALSVALHKLAVRTVG
jgi:hypothetical protein